MGLLSGIENTLNDAVNSVKEKAEQTISQLAYEEEEKIKKKIDVAENQLKELKNIDETVKTKEYHIYLKYLMIDYLNKNFKSYFTEFPIIENVQEVMIKLGIQINNDQEYNNSILIPFKVYLNSSTGANTNFSDINNFNYIISSNNILEKDKVFFNKYSNNELEIYKNFSTVKNIDDIYKLLNIEDDLKNFKETELFKKLIGGNSIFSNIGYSSNNEDANYVYFRIDFNLIDNIEHMNSKYLNYIINKYNLNSEDIENQINKNKELVLIEQNKYNIKMDILKILKIISICLVIILIFVIGYYSIGKEKINNIFSLILF